MTTETIDLKAINKLASNCGTRFHRDRRGDLSTKSPLVWKNAAWLFQALANLGYNVEERRSSDKAKYHLVLVGV